MLAVSIAHALAVHAQGVPVRIWEDKIDLPTYALGEEDPNPPFPLVRGHHIYPYTMMDDLTDRLETKSYRAVYLENEYLKATVLPDLGGRLYSLYDKAAGREVFYRNNVVKYGLVGIRGAWISGGIEFNFPDGHTAVTVSSVAFTTRQSPDGGATVVVGDTDRVTRMQWEVALTLRPGEARLEQRVTLFNATPLTNPYWFWANAAVPATDDMQFIYPMREAYPHAPWPVYTYPVYQGVDYSWYKNVRQPTSLFGRQVHRDFFGAYYHKTDYGVVHVADFREVPGKKVWTWGVAGDGLIWTDLLTDHDGAYNEIQSGRFETQLNYELIRPRRVDQWTEYWYPVRGLEGGFAEATSELALNTTYQSSGGGHAPFRVLISPVVALEDVTVLVKAGSQVAGRFGPASLKPLETVSYDVPAAPPTAGEKSDRVVVIEVKSAQGQTLARWSSADPIDGNPDFVPAAGLPQPKEKPIEKMSTEELFLRGVNQEKHGSPEAAQSTYADVLKRDPDYIPALLEEAWWRYRGADLPAAEALVARAMLRNPLDPTVHYAAGVIYRASGRLTLAADAFWASIHFGGVPAPAFAQLGELAMQRKNEAKRAEPVRALTYNPEQMTPADAAVALRLLRGESGVGQKTAARDDEASSLLRQSLSYNPGDAMTLADLAVALRSVGRLDDAAKAAEAAVDKMPLLPFARAEGWLIEQSRGAAASSGSHFPLAEIENCLEVAAWYQDLGDFDSADSVLETALKQFPSEKASPLVYYYLARDARGEHRNDQAKKWAAKAAAAPYAKVFPQRIEDAQALADAIANDAADAHADYYLGNFFFAHGRYDDGERRWMQALGGGFDCSELERNLGEYAWRVAKDLKAAAAYYEKAIQLDPNQYRLYTDLDEIDFQAGDVRKREAMFAQAPASVLDHDTVRVRRVLLLVQEHQYDQALSLLADHRFKPWEGGEIVRQMFVLANIEKGRQSLRAKKPAQAEASFRRALEYPENLGVGKPDKPEDDEALYWLGEALEAEGKSSEARATWRQAAGEGRRSNREREGAPRVYQALAIERLGRAAEAEKMLGQLTAASSGSQNAYHLYLAALAEEARKREDQARRDFHRALQLDPSLWQARLAMESTSHTSDH